MFWLEMSSEQSREKYAISQDFLNCSLPGGAGYHGLSALCFGGARGYIPGAMLPVDHPRVGQR